MHIGSGTADAHQVPARRRIELPEPLASVVDYLADYLDAKPAAPRHMVDNAAQRLLNHYVNRLTTNITRTALHRKVEARSFDWHRATGQLRDDTTTKQERCDCEHGVPCSTHAQ
ncbi:hypothetical protein Lesp02_61250 [Lentzea sp. NBRC 105346]|nr:hypothetical protein Lesp02_61250 [Lentzea sp. NBRC 105346]